MGRKLPDSSLSGVFQVHVLQEVLSALRTHLFNMEKNVSFDFHTVGGEV